MYSSLGRLAKGLIEPFGCGVVGVDISHSMRSLATSCAVSPRFVALSPEMLPWFAVRFDLALVVWVLQHCLRPAEDIASIGASLIDLVHLHSGAKSQLFVLNNFGRAVPAIEQQWVNDNIDIQQSLIEAGYPCCEPGEPTPEIPDAKE
jgi:hypothetical protein